MLSLKIGIKAKILIVMLLLTVVTFGLATLLTLDNISDLGHFTLDSCNRLGEDSLKKSKAVLLEHKKEGLLSLVIGQAMITNVQLDRLEDELSMLASLSGRYLLGEKSMVAGSDEKRFLSFEKPDSDFSKSRILVYNDDSGKEYEFNLTRVGRIHPLMKFTYSNEPILDIVFLCTSNGYYVTYPWTEPQDGYTPFQREWYKKAFEAKGKNVWIGPYISANGNRIIMTCAKAVKNFKGEIIAVCGLDITVEEITKSLMGLASQWAGSAFIVDKSGNVLARRNMGSPGMKWYDSLKKENLLQSKNEDLRKIVENMIKGKQGISKLRTDDNPEMYVVYAPVPISGWSIGIIAEASVLTESVRRSEIEMKKNIQKHNLRIRRYFRNNLKIYSIAGVIVLAIVIFWGLMFSRKITAPVLMLKRKAMMIAKGNFKTDIHLNTGDELEHLDKTFDRMTNDIARYMTHVKNTVREHEKIEQEFSVAGKIQSYMLPPDFDEVPEARIESFLKPAHEVSGDFFNYFMVDDDHLFFCIGKVVGKGVPSAMLMAQAMTLLSHLGTMRIEPQELLLRVNNTLAINNKTDMFVIAFCAFLNVKNGEMVFSNAEHIPSIYIHENKVVVSKIEQSLGLGTRQVEQGVFKQNKLNLSPGDVLLFTTNGIESAENLKGKRCY
jgi:sigma-B regulation protein RsbU (phosphoserine phosphatase)